MKIEIVEATVEHAKDLAPRLRESDKREVMASCGANPLRALTMSVNASSVAWTALLDGVPHIMWGAAEYPYLERCGVVWLLSSDKMYEIPGRFIVESEVYVAIMLRDYDTLFNHVHAQNIKSQQWLESLGFRALSRNESYGFGKEPFILYARSAN